MKFTKRDDAVAYYRNLLAQTRHDANSLALSSAGMLVAVGEMAGEIAMNATDLQKAIELQVTVLTASAMHTFARRTDDADVRTNKSRPRAVN